MLLSKLAMPSEKYVSRSKLLYFFQDKDLKQYMDDCGNIMSMHNVKVSFSVAF